MTYEEALSFIHSLEGRPWRNGLDRMHAFVERAGLAPTLNGRGYVHIAGTNGKGTTTAFVESVLRHQDWRTGAFYSPFVVDYRERIQAEGQLIEKQDLVALVERLQPIAESMVDTPFSGVTKFEFEAAMGLAYWEGKGSEWVALEVGLGGRLDATNVVQPKACIIVSISLDHTSILGSTHEAIAQEKAGIIKTGIPVVVGNMVPEALLTIERIAAEREAPLWRVGKEIIVRSKSDLVEIRTPMGSFVVSLPLLSGEFPPYNAAMALAACIAAGAVREPQFLSEGLNHAWLPGRMDWREIEGRRVLFDGAHNAAAAAALVDKLGRRPVRLVTNMVSGHEVVPFYEALKGFTLSAEVPPIDSPRALPVAAAVAQIQEVGISARPHDSVQKAIAAALTHDDVTVVVTGSNYLVGEALRLLD